MLGMLYVGSLVFGYFGICGMVYYGILYFGMLYFGIVYVGTCVIKSTSDCVRVPSGGSTFSKMNIFTIISGRILQKYTFSNMFEYIRT